MIARITPSRYRGAAAVLAALLLGACSSAGRKPATASTTAYAPPGCPAGKSALAPRASTSPLTLPRPTGPDEVGTTQFALSDPTRLDPLAPTRTPRRLLVQAWYPTAANPATCARAMYESLAAAAANEKTFSFPRGSLAGIRTTALLNAPVRAGRYPVVLYEHGLFGSLSDNTGVALQLASVGYVVVSVGVTYESPAITFPDGHTVSLSARASALARRDDVTPLITLRVHDAEFVLSQLTRGAGVPAQLRAAVDTSAVGMFGHSAGGAAALQVAHDRPQVKAALNLDGFTRQADATRGLGKPFLFLSSALHGPANEPSWPPFFAHSEPASIVQFARTGHLALTDIGSDGWIAAFGLKKVVPAKEFAINFGQPVPGTAAVIAGIVSGFFDHTLRGRPAPDLNQLRQEHPAMIKSVEPTR